MTRAALALAASLAVGCVSVTQAWRDEPPAVAKEVVFHPPTAHTSELANGMGLLVSTLGQTKTTRVGLVFDRGYSDRQSPAEAARVLAHWLEIESRGARSDAFDALGADLRVSVHTTTTRLEVDVLNADVQEAMAAIAGLIQDAGDPQAFEDARRRQLSDVLQLRQTPSRLAVSAALQAILGPEHAHLNPEGAGSKAALERLRFQDVLDTRDAWIARVNAAWVVVGPHAQQDVRAWAWDVSRAWPQREAPAAAAKAPPVRPGTVTLVPITGLDPAIVVVSKSLRGTHRRVSTETAFSAGIGLAHALLREGAQQTYGVSGRFVDDGPVHAAIAVARVPVAHAAGAAATIVGSFRGAVRYVDDQPIMRNRRSQTVRWAAAAMETDVRADALYRVLADGAPLDAMPPFGPLLAPPSSARVRSALQSEFMPEDLHVVLAGDPEVLGAQLAGTTFGVWTDADPVAPGTPPDGG